MRTKLDIPVVFFIAALAAGCSSAPAAPHAATAGATPVAGPMSTPVGPVTSDIEGIRKTARLLGLTPRSKNGAEIYSRSAAVIGTRFETTTCCTQAEVLQLEKRSQSNQDDLEALRRASLTEPNNH